MHTFAALGPQEWFVVGFAVIVLLVARHFLVQRSRAYRQIAECHAMLTELVQTKRDSR